jgi:hypothetical protein
MINDENDIKPGVSPEVAHDYGGNRKSNQAKQDQPDNIRLTFSLKYGAQGPYLKLRLVCDHPEIKPCLDDWEEC